MTFSNNIHDRIIIFDKEAYAGYKKDVAERFAKLEAENKRLRTSILNQCAENQCWIQEEDAIQPFPEKEFLESCRRYRNQLAEKRPELNAGQMTIAQLEASNESKRCRIHELEIENLRWKNESERSAKFIELLSKQISQIQTENEKLESENQELRTALIKNTVVMVPAKDAMSHLTASHFPAWVFPDKELNEHLSIFSEKTNELYLEALKERAKQVAELKSENESKQKTIEQLSEEIVKLRTTLNIERSYNF